jgi:hypothetical protein
MPVPSAITDLSQTAGSNPPAGSESPALLDDYHRTTFAFIARLRDGQGLSNPVLLASAATTDIGAQTSPFVRITGTTTITSFGSNYNGPRFVSFAGALTLTHNATSLILPGGANITTAADDCAIVVPNAATPNGWRVVAYMVAALTPGAASSILGTLGIGQGGTGQTTAAAAFNALKQAATDSASGAVELATTAEAQTGTDTARAVTPAGLGATVLGMGQTWQDVTGSRTSGTTYTNNTGRTIKAAISVQGTTGATVNCTLTVAGVQIHNSTQSSGAFTPPAAIMSAEVPPGATYVYTWSGGTAAIRELRS